MRGLVNRPRALITVFIWNVILVASLLTGCASDYHHRSTEHDNELSFTRSAKAVGMTKWGSEDEFDISPPIHLTLKGGHKGFPEQDIVLALTSAYLRGYGIRLDLTRYDNHEAIKKALKSGEIDFYWDYTGTILAVEPDLNLKPPYDAFEVYQAVKDFEQKKYGVRWLYPSRINNTYAFAVRSDDQRMVAVQTLSDLAKSDYSIAMHSYYVNDRPKDGWPSLKWYYQFEDKHPIQAIPMRHDIFRLMRLSKVDVGIVFATDQEVDLYRLRVLDDDKRFFPPYHLTPIIRESVLDENPHLERLLNSLSYSLNNDLMRYLLQRYQIDGLPLSSVAGEFMLCTDAYKAPVIRKEDREASSQLESPDYVDMDDGFFHPEKLSDAHFQQRYGLEKPVSVCN